MRLLFVIVAVLGCGVAAGSASTGRSDRRDVAILRVLHEGKAALVRGDGRRACGLLTREGRKRSLAFAQQFDGRDPALPRKSVRSCVDVVRAERRYNAGGWLVDVRGARFRIIRVRGASATVALDGPHGNVGAATLYLRRTRAGWRIDDANTARALR